MSTAVPLQEAARARVAEWRNVDLTTLREEIIPRDKPAVLKGFVAEWPIVRAAGQSPEALLEYVRARDPGHPIRIMVGRPEIKGVYFYRDDMAGLNFEYQQQPLHGALANILACRRLADAPAIYTGARAVERYFPQIGRENTLGMLAQMGKSAWSYIWLGNAVTAATHYDNMEGINCTVTGRKRFTFFPPDQLANLYVGPLELSPGGQPTSMVRLSAPDLERYPRFAQALAVATTAEVGPGDAIFIPSLWWHNVEALEPVNFSINFWWCEPAEWAAEPFGALVHSLLALRSLPAERREIWRTMFDHYVFQTEGDPVPYLPPERRGMLGPLSEPQILYLKKQLMRSLIKKMPTEMSVKILQALFPDSAQ
jgi:Cupin-like domain